MKNNKILCLHHTDLDGAMSGGIVGYWAEKQGLEVDYRLYNYGYPLEPKDFNGYSLVFAVDISFNQSSPWVYEYLGDRLIWIDHHKSAIEYEEKHINYPIRGIRGIGVGACELTWNYLFPNSKLPRLVEYLSTYDVWDKERLNWREVEKVQWGARLEYGNSASDLCNYLKLKDLGLNNYISDLKEKGETVLTYQERNFSGKIKNNGFFIPEFVIDGVGSYRVILLNTNEFCSKTFEPIYDPKYYDFMIPFALVPVEKEPGKFVVRVSLYSENPDIDLSLIAKAWGGGGHRSAAGATISMEELSELLECAMSLKEYDNWLRATGKREALI